MQFFAKMFPIEHGYSCYLFGNCTVDNSTAPPADAAAPAAAEAAPAQTPAPDPLKAYGSSKPMVFGDIAPIHFDWYISQLFFASPKSVHEMDLYRSQHHYTALHRMCSIIT